MAKTLHQRISLLREQSGQERPILPARVANQNTEFRDVSYLCKKIGEALISIRCLQAFFHTTIFHVAPFLYNLFILNF